MECKKSAMISFMVSGFLFSPKKALPTLRLYQYSCKWFSLKTSLKFSLKIMFLCPLHLDFFYFYVEHNRDSAFLWVDNYASVTY